MWSKILLTVFSWAPSIAETLGANKELVDAVRRVKNLKKIKITK
jgi:hypothetical protein